MGYFTIIDSLSDKRVDEGMVSSISKNTKRQNKDIKRMVDAVLSGQISKLSSKDMDINMLKVLGDNGVDVWVTSLKVVGTSLVVEVY